MSLASARRAGSSNSESEPARLVVVQVAEARQLLATVLTHLRRSKAHHAIMRLGALATPTRLVVVQVAEARPHLAAVLAHLALGHDSLRTCPYSNVIHSEFV